MPLHAIVGRDELDGFGKRIIDLQVVHEATTLGGARGRRRGARHALATGAA